jgi:hypothetical protein
MVHDRLPIEPCRWPIHVWCRSFFSTHHGNTVVIGRPIATRTKHCPRPINCHTVTLTHTHAVTHSHAHSPLNLMAFALMTANVESTGRSDPSILYPSRLVLPTLSANTWHVTHRFRTRYHVVAQYRQPSPLPSSSHHHHNLISMSFPLCVHVSETRLAVGGWKRSNLPYTWNYCQLHKRYTTVKLSLSKLSSMPHACITLLGHRTLFLSLNRLCRLFHMCVCVCVCVCRMLKQTSM